MKVKMTSSREAEGIEPGTEVVWESQLDRGRKMTTHVERAKTTE